VLDIVDAWCNHEEKQMFLAYDKHKAFKQPTQQTSATLNKQQYLRFIKKLHTHNTKPKICDSNWSLSFYTGVIAYGTMGS